MSSNQGPEAANDTRESAEKGIETARSAFSNLLTTARKVAEAVQSSTNTSQSTAGTAVNRGFDFAEQHIAATLDLAQKMVHAKDAKEAIGLQGEYMRSQIETLQAQAKELANLKPGQKG
ncbi:MAG: phasin family protein [Methylobacterium frigidaeris]